MPQTQTAQFEDIGGVFSFGQFWAQRQKRDHTLDLSANVQLIQIYKAEVINEFKGNHPYAHFLVLWPTHHEHRNFETIGHNNPWLVPWVT